MTLQCLCTSGPDPTGFAYTEMSWLYHDVQREAYFIIAYLFAEGVLFRPLVNCRRLMSLQVCLVSTSVGIVDRK